MKKWVKILLIVLLAVVLLAAAYVAYVFISYHRIGDQPLTPVQTPDTAPSLSAGEAYTLVSWNIGFGAYEETIVAASSWTAARSPAPGRRSA